MDQISSQKTMVSAAVLHPQVKLALAYLDCHLEDELLRYRRARSGSEVTPSSARAMRSSDSSKTPAWVEMTQPVPIDALPKQNNVTVEQTDLGFVVTPYVGADSERRFSSDDLMVNSEVEHLGDRSLYVPNHLPNDYLESSEELLRNLAQEEAGAERERRSIEGLLTPLGIGSMMLMLTVSSMVGYLAMNPSTLATAGLTASRIVNGDKTQSPPPTTTPTAIGFNGGVPTDSNELVDLSLKNLVVMGTQGQGSGLLKIPAPIAPNKSVNNLSGLVAAKGGKARPPIVIPGNPSPPAGQNRSQQAATPSTVVPPIVVKAPVQRPSLYRPIQPQKPSSSYRTPVKTVPVQLPPVRSTPTAIPSPDPAIVPAADRYRVEIPYTGDTDLEKAQKSDAGAYFKNGENGAVIQMGESYTSREAAEAKARQLKEQGFDGVEVQK